MNVVMIGAGYVGLVSGTCFGALLIVSVMVTLSQSAGTSGEGGVFLLCLGIVVR